MTILKDMQFLQPHHYHSITKLPSDYYPFSNLKIAPHNPESKTNTITTSIYAHKTVPWNRRL
jgi:hypothetical protein